MRSPSSSLFLLLSISCLAACAASPADPITAEDHTETAQSELSRGCRVLCLNPADCLLTDTVINGFPYPNERGLHSTYATGAGATLDRHNAFFSSLGTNGRACVSCHAPEDGFSVSTRSIRARFELSCGTDAIFRTVDGANSPNADVHDLNAKRAAYSLLLNEGLIRLQFPVPPTAEFEFVSANDPYHNSTANGISVFRRPLPASNLPFRNVTMWDGREPTLNSQAVNATLRHAEAASAPSAATVASIVAFESALFTSQAFADGVITSSQHATGGAQNLSHVAFAPFENPPGFIPPGAPPLNLPTFSDLPADLNVFTTFTAWNGASGKRGSVARGQKVFNEKLFTLGVIPGLGPIAATCGTCHNATNAGTVSLPVLASLVGLHAINVTDTPDLPVYTFRVKATGNLVQATDPGLAMQTGLMSDWGAFKSPPLRGLAARPPFFHNGSAATLADVVGFYDTRFTIGYTSTEKADLTAFLEAL